MHHLPPRLRFAGAAPAPAGPRILAAALAALAISALPLAAAQSPSQVSASAAATATATGPVLGTTTQSGPSASPVSPASGSASPLPTASPPNITWSRGAGCSLLEAALASWDTPVPWPAGSCCSNVVPANGTLLAVEALGDTVFCDVTGIIFKIDFGKTRLLGALPVNATTIPPQLGLLKSLRTVLIKNRNLTGEIPTAFANLTNLEHLDLSGNRLSGTLAPLAPMPSLQKLLAAGNTFNGSIAPLRKKFFVELDLSTSVNLTGKVQDIDFFSKSKCNWPPSTDRSVCLDDAEKSCGTLVTCTEQASRIAQRSASLSATATSSTQSTSQPSPTSSEGDRQAISTKTVIAISTAAGIIVVLCTVMSAAMFFARRMRTPSLPMRHSDPFRSPPPPAKHLPSTAPHAGHPQNPRANNVFPGLPRWSWSSADSSHYSVNGIYEEARVRYESMHRTTQAQIASRSSQMVQTQVAPYPAAIPTMAASSPPRAKIRTGSPRPQLRIITNFTAPSPLRAQIVPAQPLMAQPPMTQPPMAQPPMTQPPMAQQPMAQPPFVQHSSAGNPDRQAAPERFSKPPLQTTLPSVGEETAQLVAADAAQAERTVPTARRVERGVSFVSVMSFSTFSQTTSNLDASVASLSAAESRHSDSGAQ
ncbi:hypothetical protein HK105_205984 [Polyrhizophydium stewartii]|uniref:L domain-like protein n=1 Tax=Polyrhizophydium stewartii TaxID=2732419 RepID=A0ABR4N4F9_9FUNG